MTLYYSNNQVSKRFQIKSLQCVCMCICWKIPLMYMQFSENLPTPKNYFEPMAVQAWLKHTFLLSGVVQMVSVNPR